MYCLKSFRIERNNLIALSDKHGMDNGVHWLNPLIIRCEYIL